MVKHKIKFGYEIKSGKEVEIPLAHTVITGLTHESGKTTAIVGLIKRSGLKAIILKTKIGEKAISEGAVIPPFYREDFDWEYASELMESSRKEKLKFERSWIIKYAKGATNLMEFKHNIDTALAEGKLRELDKSVLISLQAYLEKILPELQYAPLSKTLDIREGINIMDLERFKEETQGLIIRSVLNEVLNKEKNTIVIIPEAWKYLPEKIGNPVKRAAEAYIRQGATNNNYLFIDSQDITGVSKVILKQVSNWILGYQREVNEIERTLDQIPLPKKSKPKSEDVATLKLGQFFVATSDFTARVYAQPSWLSDKIAKNIALGRTSVDEIEQPTQIAPFQIVPKTEEKVFIEQMGNKVPIGTIDFSKKINELREDFITNRNDFFTKFQQINETISKIYEDIYKIRNEAPKLNEDEIVMRVLQKIPVNNQSASPLINKEALISEIIAKIPQSAGAVTYTVAPLEKIKKGFLEEAKQKILADVSKLDDEQKKMLKYIEAQNVGQKLGTIIEKCLFKSQTSGGTRDSTKKKLKDIAVLELIRYDQPHSLFYPSLKDTITKYCGQHEATPQEIEQVYNYILAEVLK